MKWLASVDSTLHLMNQAFFSNALFGGIAPEQLATLQIPIEEIHCDRDEIIFEEGTKGDHVYLIGSGLVHISKRGRGGKQEILGQKHPGEFFGEMGVLLVDGARSARATALEPTTLGRISRQGLEHFLKTSPESSLHFTRVICEQLRVANSHFIQELLNTERLSLIGSMMGSIVHDLRNPIASISMVADYLKATQDDPNLIELGSLTRRAVEQMEVMIQELLDFSLGKSRINLAPTTVQHVLGILEEQILKGIADQGIEVRQNIGYDGEIVVDQNRIIRLFANIVKNAKEAMPDGGTLTLQTYLDGETLIFEIRDTGCGIPENVLARIFEPFVTHGKVNGTGLGMAIAKSVVEAHHGEIEIESVEKVGTLTRIKLPLKQ